jgi:hypothetical protein
MRWTLIVEDDEHGKVTITTDPPIDKATLANHIAQLKVNGKGYGPAFDYICDLRNAATERSRGVMLRDKQKQRDGRLIILPGRDS